MQKKILVLVANPKGTVNIELLLEINRLKEALRRSVNREQFVVECEVAVRQSDLRRHILDVKPQIIHFCGHGTEQGLFLEDDTGNAKVVSNQFLTDLLGLFADRIECVVLNACDSEPLADQLGQHLNYVIGMSQPVLDDAAIAFAEGFYDTLGAGESYEQAFEVGRNAVLGKVTQRHAPEAPGRKITAVGQAGKPVKGQNREHLIPVLKINPNPTPIKPLWLAPEVERAAVRDLLAAIASGFNTIKLFHTDEPIVLKDQYIPVQVTLERRYKHSVEAIGGYAESEAELKRIYAMKGSSEEKIEEEIKRQQVDWQKARQEHSRIIVLADPGMGKSTLLKREVGTMVQQGIQTLEAEKPLQDITLPLLMRLSTLVDEMAAMPTEEAILKIIQDRHSNLLKQHENTEVMTFLNGFLKQQLLHGKGLLLLDALDEVPDGKRPQLLEKLNDFANAYPTCPMVGTSRIVGYGGRFVDDAKDMEIVPFTQKQTEEYIDAWFRNAPLKHESVSARGLIQALRERPQIAGLAQNPLLLSLICSLYQRDQLSLPARRGQIYEQAVNCMLGEWNQTRLEHDDKRTTAKVRLLEELAYYFTTEGQEVFDYEDLYDWVERYLEEGDAPRDLRDAKTGELIAELAEEDGILQKLHRDKNDDQYLFLHRTFQEYFTASYLKRAIKKNKQNPSYVTELVRNYGWNYDWHETLTLLTGLMERPMGLIEAIVAEKDDIFQTQLLLAGRCLAECRDLSHPLVDEIIERIYKFWLAYPDAEFIRSVVVAICQTHVSLTEQLKIALNYECSDVRNSAVEVLEKIGGDNAVDGLISVLNNKDCYFRRMAAEALGRTGSDKAVDELIFSALNDKNRDVRSIAAEALRQIGSDKAVDELISILNNKDCYFRGVAAEILGKIGSDRAVDGLIFALNDECSNVKETAVWALEQIGSDKALGGLISALNDEDNYVRSRAVMALGKIESNKAVDGLISALNDEDSDVREIAAAVLRQVRSDKAVDELIPALNNEDNYVRSSATEAFSTLFNVDGLISALNDECSNVRETAVWALEQIGSDKAVGGLISALNDEDNYVRSSAAGALGKTGSDQALEALIMTLNNDEDRDVRSSAAESLGKIGSDQALEALITALKDEDRLVRQNAAGALSQIGGAVCLEKLLQLADRTVIKRQDVFPLARSWVIRFSKAGLPFIPVYPELVQTSAIPE